MPDKKDGSKKEPEMQVTRKVVTRTEEYLTPGGRDVKRTTETTYEPKPKRERRKVLYSDSDLKAMDEANRRKYKRLFVWLMGLVALIAALALAVGLVLNWASSNDAPAAEQGVIQIPLPPAVPAPESTPAPGSEGNGAEETTPETEVLPAPVPTPAPAPAPAPAPQAMPSPAPTEANTALNYIVHPFADRRDDFINYDFDRRRVCWANSSEREGFPEGCVFYDALDAETKTTFDTLCRQHYAFAEVCPADITLDVVFREMDYHKSS